VPGPLYGRGRPPRRFIPTPPGEERSYISRRATPTRDESRPNTGGGHQGAIQPHGVGAGTAGRGDRFAGQYTARDVRKGVHLASAASAGVARDRCGWVSNSSPSARPSSGTRGQVQPGWSITCWTK